MSHRTNNPNTPAQKNALDSLRADLFAIPTNQLEPIRLDIGDAVITALGVSAKLESHRGSIVAALGEPAARYVDRLYDAALACNLAHGDHLTTLHGASVEEIAAKLSQTRKVLLGEAQSLVTQKKLHGSVLAELVGGTGYKAMCLDIVQLVSALRAQWAAIEEHTSMTTVELDQAEALATELATTLGENEQASSPTSPSADLRQRAYTLFVHTYEEIRRQLAYVRWAEGDADEIAPSLCAGRKKSKKDDDDMHGASTHPSPMNGNPPIAPGHPGGSPFVT